MNRFTLGSGRVCGFLAKGKKIQFVVCDQKSGYMIWSRNFVIDDPDFGGLTPDNTQSFIDSIIRTHWTDRIYFLDSPGNLKVVDAETGEQLELINMELHLRSSPKRISLRRAERLAYVRQ